MAINIRRARANDAHILAWTMLSASARISRAAFGICSLAQMKQDASTICVVLPSPNRDHCAMYRICWHRRR